MLSLGLGLGLSQVRGGVGAADSLLSLFANGERGFLFDGFADLCRIFTTSSGTTPIANDGDSVGKIVDRLPASHAARQAINNSFCPAWRQNAGKPYLQGGGTDVDGQFQ